MSRGTYNLPGLSPSNMAAPDLVRAGGLFFTSGVRGVDLTTGRLGETPEQQFTLAWRNLRALVEEAGLTLGEVGLVTNFIGSQDHRPLINPGWLELFPHAGDRPARKTTAFPMQDGVAVELQAFGVSGAPRRPIEVPGLAHRDPLPNGARLGDYVFSSVIVAQDRTTEKLVEGPERQTDQCFDNLYAFMEAAGGSIQDVALQWVYLNDFAYQPYMVDVYLKPWPEGGYQAARKTIRYPMAAQIQMQVFGRVGGEGRNFEVPGVGHHDPIPLGARVGDLFCSSGIHGVDPSGSDPLEPVEDLGQQAFYGVRNLRSLVEAGGGALDDVGHITVMLHDYAALPAIDAEWAKAFPDPANRPARQVMKLGVAGRTGVQFHMIASV